MEPAPDTLAEPLRRCVEGLFPVKAGHVAMLRDQAVLDLLEQALFA
jgi:hypothetical protein